MDFGPIPHSSWCDSLTPRSDIGLFSPHVHLKWPHNPTPSTRSLEAVSENLVPNNFFFGVTFTGGANGRNVGDIPKCIAVPCP